MFTAKKFKPAKFTEFLAKYPDLIVPIEQTPVWTDYETRIDGRSSLGLFLYYKNDKAMAAAQLFKYDAPLRSYVWLKFGPIWLEEPTAADEQELVDAILEQLKTAPTPKPLFLRMQLRHQLPKAVNPFEHNMYDETVIVDLTPATKKIFSSFKNDVRRSYRLASKQPLEVKKYTGEEAAKQMRDGLHELMANTGKRAGFRVHPSSVYEAMLTGMPDNVALYVSYLEDKPACWAIGTIYGNEARYYFAANNELARDSYATYFNLWNLMQDMKNQGAKQIDLMGIASESYPELKNVTVFKKKFTKKTTVTIPSTYDIPISKAKYKALTTALNARRNLRKALNKKKAK
ncbi:MAG: peptidoglycan bridge formation glycyltransferase FemA/FemB family protein [Micrococcaceae bacterium]